MLFGRMEPRNPSSTDLTDQAWALMAPDVPTAKPGGRLAPYPQRDILEALFAMLRSGCAWRLRPHALPPWPRVYQYCWRGRKAGTWQVRHDLRRCHPGGHGGHQRPPSAAVIASQSGTTTEQGEAAAWIGPNRSRGARDIASSIR